MTAPHRRSTRKLEAEEGEVVEVLASLARAPLPVVDQLLADHQV